MVTTDRSKSAKKVVLGVVQNPQGIVNQAQLPSFNNNKVFPSAITNYIKSYSTNKYIIQSYHIIGITLAGEAT